MQLSHVIHLTFHLQEQKIFNERCQTFLLVLPVLSNTHNMESVQYFSFKISCQSSSDFLWSSSGGKLSISQPHLHWGNHTQVRSTSIPYCSYIVIKQVKPLIIHILFFLIASRSSIFTVPIPVKTELWINH